MSELTIALIVLRTALCLYFLVSAILSKVSVSSSVMAVLLLGRWRLWNKNDVSLRLESAIAFRRIEYFLVA